MAGSGNSIESDGGTMNWVGLTGKMGAGKDFTLTALREMDIRFVRVSFADALRAEMTVKLNPTDPFLFYTKPYSEEVRRLLQWWGTDLRRADDPDYWVKKTEQFGLKQAKLERWPVFTDVRFPNEADMIKRNGGIIVRVLAPIEVRTERLGTIPPNHASETAMDDYPVDMHITSTEENSAYEGQLQRIIVEATIDDLRWRIQNALDRD
jgi:hypothetical protein